MDQILHESLIRQTITALDSVSLLLRSLRSLLSIFAHCSLVRRVTVTSSLAINYSLSMWILMMMMMVVLVGCLFIGLQGRDRRDGMGLDWEDRGTLRAIGLIPIVDVLSVEWVRGAVEREVRLVRGPVRVHAFVLHVAALVVVITRWTLFVVLLPCQLKDRLLEFVRQCLSTLVIDIECRGNGLACYRSLTIWGLWLFWR